MAESLRNNKFPNLPVTYWTPSDYDQEYNKNSRNYCCKVCNLVLNSSEQYEQHVQGQRHLSKEKSQNILVFDRQTNDSPELDRMYQATSLTSLDSLRDDRDVSPSNLHNEATRLCELCNVTFTSECHRNSHYRGKKHLAAVKKKNMKDIPLFCEDCSVSFSSEISAKDHFDSDKHKKKITLVSNSSLSVGTDNTRWLRCNVCNVNLNSEQQLRIHCDSPKHMKKERTTSTLRRCSSDLFLKNELKDSSSETSIPKIVMEPIDMKISEEMANISHMDCDPNKIFKNFENSLNYVKSSHDASGNRGLQLGDVFKKCIHSDSDSGGVTGTQIQIASDRERSSPNLPHETTPKMMNITSNSSLETVANSVQLNYNPSDITTKFQNSPTITNNLSLPEETTTQFNNDSANSNTEIDISKDEIAKIIDRIERLHVTPQISENKKSIDLIGNEGNITNGKISKPSATSHGSRQLRTASSTSPPETKEDEIPFLHKRWIEKIERNGKIICYFCNLCDTKLFSGAVINHIEGMNHRQKMMTRQVPKRDLPPVKQTCDDATEEAFNLTTFFPRAYQVELFEKCHLTDSIIFLPTGTGKTLCASMLISHMLKQNPKRSVLFLVDKVLLVFQQKNFIRGQLKQKFLRFDFEDNDKLVERELDIACVCGGTVETQDKPLWMHDIVISTAAFCSNMMNQNVLRWTDFSFVVVDEAHHCVKNHPFHQIFLERHSKLEKSQRPKILGLTASPAGQETLDGTIKMLVYFSKAMGDAKITIVEDTVDQLKKFKSNAKFKVEMLPPSNEEVSFNNHLQKYLMQCLLYLKEKTNISNYVDFITSGDEVVLNAERLDDLQSAFNVLTIDRDKAAATSLLWHVKKITFALAVSLEMGIPLALEELKSLIDKSNNMDSFSKALELGLPSKALQLGHRIREMCEKYTKVMEDAFWEQDEIMSTVHFLIHKITHLLDKQDKNAIVLVLVKQRATAIRLSTIMQKSNTMRQHNLSCVSLVGHGSGTNTGMNVNDQKKTLEEIKSNQHQVIIATSVAEEGIDLPQCSLVITMKPPTSITALVQMRGRARKKNSLFLTICGNERQKLKLENLLKQEKIMEMATQKLVDFYKET